MIKKILRVITIIYIILIAVFSLIPLEGQIGNTISHNDKLAHFLAYLLLGFLLVYTYDNFFYDKYHIAGFILVSLISIVLEYAQIRFTSRTFSFNDIMANISGAFIGVLISAIINLRKQK